MGVTLIFFLDDFRNFIKIKSVKTLNISDNICIKLLVIAWFTCPYDGGVAQQP